jgi:1,4-dihydroxy-2-naphthoyl-CoA synthase
MGSHAVLTVDRPEARNALTGATYFGIRYAIDRVTMDASVFGPEAREGWEAFRDKRSPEWVPEDLRTGRL